MPYVPDQDYTEPKTRFRKTKPAIKGTSTLKTSVWTPSGNALTPTISKNEYSGREGRQITTSESHPSFFKKKGGLGDHGGGFYTNRYYMYSTGGHTRLKVTIPGSLLGRTVYEYNGPILAVSPTSVQFPSSGRSSNDDLDEYGATAISLVKPTNPVAGLTAALAEIRKGGLPHLPGSQTWREGTLKARNAGDEYLNAQFGWVPLANDIGQFANGVTHASDVISRYRSGIGKLTRRSFHFPEEKTVSETMNTNPGTSPWGLPSAFTGEGSSNGTLVTKTETVKRRWFSGAFTYYFPSSILGSKKLADLGILAKQLGLFPTPDVAWQVAPWSWAVDWFSNTGDVISNWSSFHTDGLVMVYGYLMEHTTTTVTYTRIGAKSRYGRNLTVSDLVLVNETKVRRPANPYGFGVQWDGLSAFQTSILGALGLTKGRR